MSEFERELRAIKENRDIQDEKRRNLEMQQVGNAAKLREQKAQKELNERVAKYRESTAMVESLLTDLANATWQKGEWGMVMSEPNSWTVGRAHYYGRKMYMLPLIGQTDRYIDCWKPINKKPPSSGVNDSFESRYGITCEKYYYQLDLKGRGVNWRFETPRGGRTKDCSEEELEMLLKREIELGELIYTPDRRVRFG